ncbi:hypothetical protein C4577_06490 [Candidatus Parcubacteria bacterium]|nr:MAG: hypothetical protein C4577_06490 [Candidatus Parcubacteria bacterium]
MSIEIYDKLKEIESRLNNTSRGDWELSGKYRIIGPPSGKWDTKTIARVRANQDYRDPKVDEANALFLAHSKQDITYLVDEVKRLLAMLLFKNMGMKQ